MRTEQVASAAAGEVRVRAIRVLHALRGPPTGVRGWLSLRPPPTSRPTPAWRAQGDRARHRLNFLLKQAEIFQHFVPEQLKASQKKCVRSLVARRRATARRGHRDAQWERASRRAVPQGAARCVGGAVGSTSSSASPPCAAQVGARAPGEPPDGERRGRGAAQGRGGRRRARGPPPHGAAQHHHGRHAPRVPDAGPQLAHPPLRQRHQRHPGRRDGARCGVGWGTRRAAPGFEIRAAPCCGHELAGAARSTSAPPSAARTRAQGLGKTLQTISLCAYLYEYRGIKGPHMVIVPKSTMGNWCNEFRRFCPVIRVAKFHGNQEERVSVRARVPRPNCHQQHGGAAAAPHNSCCLVLLSSRRSARRRSCSSPAASTWWSPRTRWSSSESCFMAPL